MLAIGPKKTRALQLASFMILLGGLVVPAAADGPLQVYGLTLDETHLGDRFCEHKDARLPIPQPPACVGSPQTLPRIKHVDTEEMPSPHTRLNFEQVAGQRPEGLDIWYQPTDRGGQSFMIETQLHTTLDLNGARQTIIDTYGAPALEFTHADLEARGLRLFDLTLGILIYAAPVMSADERSRMVTRVKRVLDPNGEQFGLFGYSIPNLARHLGPDFRGAVVEIGESGFGHHSVVNILLLDLPRAGTVFNLPN